MTSTDTAAPAPPTEQPAGRPLWRLAGPGLVVGAATALHRLDHRGLWLDEAYTLGSVHQLRSAVPRTSWTMSGYYAVLRGWLAVSESVWWMRSLSVVAALAALVATVALARRLVGGREALLAGVLVALSPLWLTYAQEARSYGFVMALVALAWLAADHGLADDDPTRRRRWWLLHTAATALLPLLHGLSLLAVLPQVALLVVAGVDRATALRAMRGLGLGLLLTAVLAQGASDEVGDWVDPVSLDVIGFNLERFLSRWLLVRVGLGAVVVVGVVVVVLAAARAPKGVDRARALVPLLWGLAPPLLLLLVSLVRPSLVPRYAVGCVPGLALLMAAAVERVGRPRWPAAARGRAVAALAVVVALAAGHVWLHTRPVDGWTVAARRIAAEARPGDTVLLGRETTTRPPFEAAWRDVDPVAPVRLVPSDRPLGEVLRFEPDETDTTVRWNEARAAGRLWVVADEVRLELDRLPSLTEDGTAGRPASHREVARWRAPRSSIWVVLLEPI